MEQCIATILARRSIRKFSQDFIADQIVNLLLQSAISAPSSMNKQARHYTVFQGRQNIDELNTEVKKATARMPESRYFERVMSKEYTIHYQAPLFIMVLANPSATLSPDADCATALQNMFLAAHSLNVGSCWINQLNPLSNEPEFSAYLQKIGIPKGFSIYGCGAFGYLEEKEWPREPQRTSGNITWIGRSTF